MKAWFIELTNTYKAALVSLFIALVVYGGLCFGYFINRPDLPNGLIAGGALGSLSYLTLGLVNEFDKKKNRPVLSIVITIIRFLLIGALIVLAALLEYKMGYLVLNVFTVIGGYSISLLTYLIIVLIEKKHV